MHTMTSQEAAYLKARIRVLYRPSHVSEIMANSIGVRNEKTKKPLEMDVALDCPRPNAPGTA